MNTTEKPTDAKQWAAIPLDLWSRVLAALRAGRKPEIAASVDYGLGCQRLIDLIADAEDKDAIVILEPWRGAVAKSTRADGCKQRGDPKHKSHFSTCPNADQHRRAKS